MRIFITGGGGFIGSYLCNSLIRSGHEVASLDSAASYVDNADEALVYQIRLFKKRLMEGVVKYRDDVRHVNALVGTLDEFNPDAVVNLANLPLANRSHRNPEEAYEGILSSTYHLLMALANYRDLKKKDVKLVHTSSSMVYGDFTDSPQPENVVLNPKEIYGCFKAASEDMVCGFKNDRGVPSIIIRPSAVYGFGDFNRRVVQVFVEAAAKGEPIEVKNPSTTLLDFTYVKDLVEGFRLAIEKGAEGVEGTFNITTGSAKSLAHLVDVVRFWCPSFKVKERIEDDYRPNRGTLDIRKARKILGYSPQWSLEDGVGEYFVQVKEALK
jgi:nucleoside-diphosphate-sugar epimerase